VRSKLLRRGERGSAGSCPREKGKMGAGSMKGAAKKTSARSLYQGSQGNSVAGRSLCGKGEEKKGGKRRTLFFSPAGRGGSLRVSFVSAKWKGKRGRNRPPFVSPWGGRKKKGKGGLPDAGEKTARGNRRGHG